MVYPDRNSLWSTFITVRRIARYTLMFYLGKGDFSIFLSFFSFETNNGHIKLIFTNHIFLVNRSLYKYRILYFFTKTIQFDIKNLMFFLKSYFLLRFFLLFWLSFPYFSILFPLIIYKHYFALVNLDILTFKSLVHTNILFGKFYF